MTRQSRKATAVAIISTTRLTNLVAASSSETGAILPLKGTTVTAYEVPNTTGEAVIDSTTYSLRGPGLTLSNGDVVSVLFDGIGDGKTTQTYGNLVTQQVPNPTVHNPLTTVVESTISGGATASSDSGDLTTITGSGPTSGPSAQSAASSSASASSSSVESSNMGTKQQSIGGGKVVALVGALAAVVLCGL